MHVGLVAGVLCFGCHSLLACSLAHSGSSSSAILSFGFVGLVFGVDEWNGMR
jgi:hypothetical protein